MYLIRQSCFRILGSLVGYIAAVHFVANGPSRHFAATQQTVTDESTADIALPSESQIYQRGAGTTPSFFCRLDDDVVY
jgi:hypothetical protein